jgi:hypothetical protein
MYAAVTQSLAQVKEIAVMCIFRGWEAQSRREVILQAIDSYALSQRASVWQIGHSNQYDSPRMATAGFSTPQICVLLWSGLLWRSSKCFATGEAQSKRLGASPRGAPQTQDTAFEIQGLRAPRWFCAIVTMFFENLRCANWLKESGFTGSCATP